MHAILILQFVWLFSVATLGPVTYDGKDYPTWAIVVGWCLGVSSVLPIPGFAIYQILRTEGTLKEVNKK